MMIDADTFEHPVLGTFTWEDEVESWARVVEVPLARSAEEVSIHLFGYEQDAVTPGQAELAERLVAGLLAERWPEVQREAVDRGYATIWDFEARRAHTSVVVYDDHRYTVQTFMERPGGHAPDLHNDLPMSFDFRDPSPARSG